MPMYRRARLGIGYLPQEASIFRGLTVEQNIRAVLEVVERSRKERERTLDALLEEFHITHLRKSPSMSLSGGERRRLEIARALASRPHYMLLDEPFAGIDPIAVADIQQLVRHLTARGIGVLITDHNVRETLEPDRPRLHHPRWRGPDARHGRRHRRRSECAPALSWRELHALIAGALLFAAASRFAAEALSVPLSLDKQKPGQFDRVVLRHAGPAPAISLAGARRRAMALSAKLQLRQSQSLVMTPQLMQSIKLLQLTHLELERFVDEEIERNPLLERVEPQDDRRADQAHKTEATEDARADDWFEADGLATSESISDNLDASLENVFPDDPGAIQKLGPDLAAQWKSAATGTGGDRRTGFDLEDMAAARLTLRDHVGEQIAFAFYDPASRLIARELTDGLDDAGYFRGRHGRNCRAPRDGTRRRVERGAGGLPVLRSGRTVCRATSRNALRCSSKRAIGSIRRCAARSPISTCWRAAISRR